jgi:hypothetical protein
MPATQQQPTFNAKEAERFAALMAGGDNGNPNEAEAMGKLCALRRMAAAKSIRLVDALELPEIRRAIDDQMQPDRKENPEFQTALEQATKLREELTARSHDVRILAGDLVSCKELLQRREREYDALRRRLASAAAYSPAVSCGSGRGAWVMKISFLILGLAAVVAAWVLNVVRFVEGLFH